MAIDILQSSTKELGKFEDFGQICQLAFGKGDKKNSWYDMEKIESSVIAMADHNRKEEAALYFLHNYEMLDDSDLMLQIYVSDMTRVLLLVNRKSVILSFCNKLISYFESSGICKLSLVDNSDLTKSLLKILINTLKKKSTPTYVSNAICKFLLLLEPVHYNRYLQLSIIQIVNVKYSDLWNIIQEENGSEIVQNGYQSISLNSKINYYTESLSQHLFLYAHVLSISNKDYSTDLSQSNILELPKFLLLCMSVLTTAHNFEVSWAATSVLIEYNLKFTDKPGPTKHLEAVVLDLITKEISSNITFHNAVSKYNVTPTQIPLSLLVKLLNISPSLAESLEDLNYNRLINNIITNDYDSKSPNMSYIEAYKFSMCLTILSFLGAISEKVRFSVSQGKELNNIIINSLDKHGKLLKALQKVEINVNHLRILEISNRLVYSACLVLRSLSRSASLLRTYFTSLGLADTFMAILQFDTGMLLKINTMDRTAFINENALHILILGVISNLVIEFSYAKDRFNLDLLMKLLLHIFENPVYEEKIISALSIIRNALFGTNSVFKEKFLEIIGLSKIFELCNNSNRSIKIQSFNVLRNLLADSSNEVNIIYNKFSEFNQENGYDFIEFLSRQLHESNSSELDVSICYCLVHLAASNVNNKISILKNVTLLANLMDVLASPATNDSQCYWEAKTAIAWIIINLTCKDGNSSFYNLTRFNDDEATLLYEVSNRSKLLITLRFQECLNDLADGCPSQDFVERAGKAIFQLMVTTNTN